MPGKKTMKGVASAVSTNKKLNSAASKVATAGNKAQYGALKNAAKKRGK